MFSCDNWIIKLYLRDNKKVEKERSYTNSLHCLVLCVCVINVFLRRCSCVYCASSLSVYLPECFLQTSASSTAAGQKLAARRSGYLSRRNAVTDFFRFPAFLWTEVGDHKSPLIWKVVQGNQLLIVTLPVFAFTL